MGLFRRREPLHVRLAREGGLLEPERETMRPSWDKVGIHGVARPREWDAVVTAEAPELRGAELEFVVLPDGTLLVEDDVGDADLSPLADALEQSLEPPYRARGVRTDPERWGVSARKIEVKQIRVDGDEVVLSVRDGERSVVVDGMPTFGSIPGLEHIGDSYVARATRLDGDLWEVQVDPL